METGQLSESPDMHAEREPPTQGVFIGYLALGLLIFALLVALVGIGAGATHGWQ
jgi:hypothetical protein